MRCVAVLRSVLFGHVLHEKGLQRQKGVVSLVGSPKERTLFVPVINRWSTDDEPIVNRSFCSSIGLHRNSLSVVVFLHCLCFWGDVQATCLRCFGECEEGLFPRCTVLLAKSCPIPPRHPAVRPDATRPGYVRVLDSTGIEVCDSRAFSAQEVL